MSAVAARRKPISPSASGGRPGGVRLCVLMGSIASPRQAGSALCDHGVRTIVDLRDDDEIGPDAAPRPAGLRAADYELGTQRLTGYFAALGTADQGPVIRGTLARKGTTARGVLLATMAGGR
jgi:hypothetical protein